MKNLKNVICHIGTLLVSILMIVFLSQAHTTVRATVMGVTGSSSIGGFGLNGEGATDTLITAYAFVIIATIVLSLLIVLSILNLLADFNVIKNNKIMSIANVVLSTLAFICAVVIIGCVGSEVSEASKLLGNSKDMGVYVGFGAILNVILGGGLLPLAILPIINFKKKSK